jgi:UDP-N-acetylglucosamine--N-acetylmuramyl-(pentapeptide) pyrophosphoryl-undecaprenol N-acetylglucosamine transferase
MTSTGANTPFVAIACGGTGGHLFPGLAVAEQLQKRGCAVTLLISPKDVDQEAVKSARGMEIFTLPAVGLQNRNYFSFAGSFVKSLFAARKIFRKRRPAAVLAMGGFTSAPPIWVGKDFGAKTFLHESNTIPGRANRFLARFVDEAFVGFPSAAARLRARKVTTTGTPVRPQFQLRDPATCRIALGLDPNRPTLLVMGGSQGASGINELVVKLLPLLAERVPQLQLFHLAGPKDADKIRQAAATHNVRAIVHSFFAEMELALGAATVAVSRAGASSLAEIAAMRVPSVLIPFPAAADNHQFFNARSFEETGAAHSYEQKRVPPEKTESLILKMLAGLILKLIENAGAREKMQTALAQWHAPKAAEQIAEIMLAAIFRSADSRVRADESLRETRGQGCPRSDAVERQNFSAA